MNPASLTIGQAPAKPVANYKLVGTTTPRIDIPDKVTGKYTYVHNLRVPGMLHARVVRPRGQGAVTSQNHYPLSVDETSIKHIPNVQVVQVGELPRGRRAEGVRRDPGGCAAEGRLEERSEASGLRQLLVVAAPGGRYEHDEPRPLHGERRQRRQRSSQSAAKTVSATYKYAVQRPHVDRPDVRDRRRARQIT